MAVYRTIQVDTLDALRDVTVQTERAYLRLALGRFSTRTGIVKYNARDLIGCHFLAGGALFAGDWTPRLTIGGKMHSDAMRYHRLNGRMYCWNQSPTWSGAMFVLNHEDHRILGIVEERSSGCVWSVRIVSAGLVQVLDGATASVVAAQCAVDAAVDEFLSVGWLLTC